MDSNDLLYNIADDNVSGPPIYVTARARATFDGAGNGTFVELAKSRGTLQSSVTITYAVSADGGLTINGQGASERGTILQDGSMLSVVWFDITSNYVSLGIGIKQ